MEAASRMEILVGSDLHNDGQALEWFCGLAETHCPDVVVFLGDFITGEPIRFLKEALASIRELADHVLVVPGNHDPRQALVEIDIAAFDGLKHLHKQSTELYGLSFAGLGGSVVTPKGDGELEFADEGFSGLLAPQLPADVWLLHCPLHSILDQNPLEVMLGSQSLFDLWKAQTVPPRLVLSGHAHDAPGTEVQGKTTFVNPGALTNRSAAFVSFSGGKLDVRPVTG